MCIHCDYVYDARFLCKSQPPFFHDLRILLKKRSINCYKMNDKPNDHHDTRHEVYRHKAYKAYNNSLSLSSTFLEKISCPPRVAPPWKRPPRNRIG